MNPLILRRLTSLIHKPATHLRRFSASINGNDSDWNDSWETAWLPPHKPTTSTTQQDPWEDPPPPPLSSPSPDVDTETRAFVQDMNENWEQRSTRNNNNNNNNNGQLFRDGGGNSNGNVVSGVEGMKRDYRVKKQKIHAGLWVKEIEKREEARLMGDDVAGDNIQRLLDSCSEIFDSPNADIDNSKFPSSSELKNKPDGWETTAKAQDGSAWEMSQREDDVLLQEFERRIAFCKFQIASFIKTHIFSRRRPIDGWKYMIEEIGPNARKGKGSVSRIPSLSDEATQPFREERTPIATNAGYLKGR